MALVLHGFSCPHFRLCPLKHSIHTQKCRGPILVCQLKGSRPVFFLFENWTAYTGACGQRQKQTKNAEKRTTKSKHDRSLLTKEQPTRMVQTTYSRHTFSQAGHQEASHSYFPSSPKSVCIIWSAEDWGKPVSILTETQVSVILLPPEREKKGCL